MSDDTWRVRCGCCGRRRNIMAMWPIEHPDGSTLLVCEDRHGCMNLYMPVRLSVGGS